MPAAHSINSSVLRKFASICDCSNCHDVDCIIVSSFVRQSGIHVENNQLLLDHLVEDDRVYLFLEYLQKKHIRLALEDLSVLFEFVISPKEKKVNGAVYTPEYIREYIVSSVLNRLNGDLSRKKYADISCGCGGFLVTLARFLHKRGIPYGVIFSDCIYGVDIAEYSIVRAQLMLSLLALEEEDVHAYQFNLFQADSLSFCWDVVPAIKDNGGFDVIVGNPPYVGAPNIDEKSRALVKQWEVSQSGKADMYISFFQIGIDNLVESGVLGYITVNNFYRSLNGRAFRQYLANRRQDVHLIDFGAEQVFHGRSTYTCLCFVHNVHDGAVYYHSCNSSQLDQLAEADFHRFSYQSLAREDIWPLSSPKESSVINAVRQRGVPLGEFATIRNGIATLKNGVYMFMPTRHDAEYYYFDSFGKEEKIEIGICRDVVRGSRLRCETDIEIYKEKIIYPYRIINDSVISIQEDEFKMNYPFAYNYLRKNKKILSKRSGADRLSPWYSYGRSQALNISGFKLLFPYISDKPSFILCEDKELLFFNGYCIADESIEKLCFLKKLLCSRLFWYYIKAVSKPYGGEYYALAKNYVMSFGVAELTEEQMHDYMQMTQEDSDRMIEAIYGVCLD